jgi:hypothetical protein
LSDRSAMLTIQAGLMAARDVNNECVGRLRYRDGDARQASFK